jgi:hypothetical protein
MPLKGLQFFGCYRTCAGFFQCRSEEIIEIFMEDAPKSSPHIFAGTHHYGQRGG